MEVCLLLSPKPSVRGVGDGLKVTTQGFAIPAFPKWNPEILSTEIFFSM